MFSGKVVLITGASSGSGAETAREFAKLGADLALTGRSKDNLDKVSKTCEQLSPAKSVPLNIIADIKVEKDIERIIESTIEHFKKLDVLVNNAGVTSLGCIETTTLQQYDDIMRTNFRGPYYVTMLATPYLVKSKGNIVNVSSVAGIKALPKVLAYGASKAALDHFTRCVALSLAPKGVRCNSVNPGDIVTGIHMKGIFSKAEEYNAYMTEKCKLIYPIGRAGESKEVASVIAFLASDAASNITGVILPVDGGRHASSSRLQ